MVTKSSICKLERLGTIFFVIITISVILDIVTTIIGFEVNGTGMYNQLTMDLFITFGLLGIIIWVLIKIVAIVLLFICTKLIVNKLKNRVVLVILYLPLFITYIGANLYTLSTLTSLPNINFYIPEPLRKIADNIFAFCVNIIRSIFKL